MDSAGEVADDNETITVLLDAQLAEYTAEGSSRGLPRWQYRPRRKICGYCDPRTLAALVCLLTIAINLALLMASRTEAAVGEAADGEGRMCRYNSVWVAASNRSARGARADAAVRSMSDLCQWSLPPSAMANGY